MSPKSQVVFPGESVKKPEEEGHGKRNICVGNKYTRVCSVGKICTPSKSGRSYEYDSMCAEGGDDGGAEEEAETKNDTSIGIWLYICSVLGCLVIFPLLYYFIKFCRKKSKEAGDDSPAFDPHMSPNFNRNLVSLPTIILHAAA